MADWKNIPDTDVDPDAPVTSELMYALRDNPVAIAEGAVGAPRVNLSSNTFNISGTAGGGVVGLDGVGEVLCIGISSVTGSPNLRVRYTNDNGGTWGGYYNLQSPGGHSNWPLLLTIPLIQGQVRLQQGSAPFSLLSVSPPVGCNGFNISWTISSGAGSLSMIVSKGIYT